MKNLIKAILSMAILTGFPVTAMAERANVCTISPMCTYYYDQLYYGLFVGTQIVNALNAQNIELSFCADDSWKASQAVSSLKNQAKDLVANGTCKVIINRTIY